MFRRLTTPQLVLDVLLATFWLLVGILFQGGNGIGVFEGITVLGMALALAFRRRSPALALGVAWATAIVEMSATLQPTATNLAIIAVLYATAAYGGRVVKWLGLASVGVGAATIAVYTVVLPAIASLAIEPLFSSTSEVVRSAIVTFLATLFAFGLSWTLGLLAKTWRTAGITRRAQVAAERAVVIEQERNRIARDMHDVVAHSLAVVIAQADGARYAREKDPASVDAALTTIASTAREALGDVRLLLGQLRHSQEVGPQPVLDDLERLFDQLRAAGLTIDFEQSGPPTSLATSQQLAVYRIVQEALTNALRHGDTTQPVVVRFAWAADAVTATITSALRAAPQPPDSRLGHGLPGMRERAILIGGTVTAGPRDAEWVVTAEIPVTVQA
ncbi:MAG: histidine kinase [Rhodoglobus sp.]